MKVRCLKDLYAGLFFVGVAGSFAVLSLRLPMGTSARMGAGYFPWMLSGLLGLLGIALLVRGVKVEGEAPTGIQWRGLACITAAAVAFGAAILPLGFVPALALAVLISTLGSSDSRPHSAVALTVGLALFCWALFIKGLQMPWPAFSLWLMGY